MLLDVKDGLGQDQQIVAPGQESPTDASGILLATGDNEELLAANGDRAGWFFQNAGANPMQINELGGDASKKVGVGIGAWNVPPGGTWPPPGFALTTAQINISGTKGDAYVCREWSTTPDDG